MRKLTIIADRGGVCADLLQPVLFHRSELQEKYGFQIRICVDGYRRDDILNSELIWLQERQPNQASIRQTIDDLRAVNPDARIAYWDSNASSYARFIALTDTVDAYVRRNLFRDLDQHMRSYRCGRIFAEFISDYYNLPATWSGNNRIRPENRRKLVLGWDIGWKCISPGLPRGAAARCAETKSRTIDVCCRVGIPDGHSAWYTAHRRAVLDKLGSLDGCKVQATERRLPRNEYLSELRNSKIAVSPFGWGEVCWRDFEAIASGCLLIKPSMEHLRTHPSEYIDGETYVSVRWDLEDLEDKCRYYLAHPEERLRIVNNAVQALDKIGVVENYARTLQLIDDVANDSAASTCQDGVH